MTTMSHLYTDFSRFPPGAFFDAASEDEAVQDAQLTGFEAGYQAGWDDAIKATGEEGEKLTADFVQSVQDLSFTYHEAFAKLSSGMKSLMSQLVTSVLPEVARDGLHLQLIDQFEALIISHKEDIIQLVASPSARPIIESVLSGHSGIPFVISDDVTLADNQVFLRVNQEEREINTNLVLEEIRNSIDAFFSTTLEREVAHG
jgi:flagellar assembly protein FliH